MKLPRRNFLHLAVGAAALPAVSRLASAQAYPSRPVRILVGFPAGGNADTIARPMGQWLSERLGQPFIIENRPGAGTNIATETVVRAPADGYTLLMVGPTQAINATLYERLNFIRDIAPVAGIIHARRSQKEACRCRNGEAQMTNVEGPTFAPVGLLKRKIQEDQSWFLLVALPRDSNPCFRRERARLARYLIVLPALAPASPRPRVLPAIASVHRGRVAPHSCWARAVGSKNG